MKRTARIGMAMFLLNEAVFFFMLLVAFVYFRGPAAHGPVFRIPVASICTACLVASSYTVWRASADAKRARIWLWITLFLGFVFLLGEGAEYVHVARENLNVAQSVFGTAFFTLTGLHGLHVVAGIVLLMLGLVRQAIPVQSVAMYWQFTGLVWLAIFAVIYVGALV